MLEKVIRHKQVFDEKENDNKNLNKKTFLNASMFKSQQSQNNVYIHNCEKLLLRPSLNNPANNIYSARDDIKISPNLIIRPTLGDPLSIAYCKLYRQQLLRYYQHKLLLSSNIFLSNHKITSSLRARMLDWMIEVTQSYKFIPKTYFAAVQLMDRYFQMEKQQIPIQKLHIIGVISMLIASKMQEVYPFRLRTIFQKIVHRKIDIKDLVEMEGKIIKALDFKTITTTFYDHTIASIYCKQVQQENYQRNTPITPMKMQKNLVRSIQMYNSTSKNNPIQNLTTPQLELLERICSYLGKYVCYNYQILTSYSKSIQAKAVLSLALEILQINFFNEQQSINTEACKQELLQTICNFKKNYKGLGNIIKHSDETIVKNVQDFINLNQII